jgi:chromosome segregation ATPase
LRRIVTDLSALAAVGSFDPDPPGALAGDREPPGFDAIGMAAPETTQRADDQTHASPKERELTDANARKEADAARARQERERLELERRKAEEERARKRVERERLEVALRSTKAKLDTRTQRVDRLQSELAEAEKTVAQTRADIADLESRLSALD